MYASANILEGSGKMCIIVYKPAGIESPSWQVLHNCFENNQDGAGFMYVENGKVYFEKGFMSWRSFKKALKPFKNRTDLPMAIHFRITTHGGTEKGLCHPFPLTENKKELKAISGTTNVGIVHNGCISMVGKPDIGMSDTSDFIRKYANIVITSPKWYNNPNANKVLAELIGSKMLVLSNDGHGEVVGNGWNEVDGVLFSNSSFQKYYWCKYNDEDDGYNDRYEEYHPTYCRFWFEENGETERNVMPKECEGCIEKSWCWGVG